nr:arsenate reductase (glutaredoxin) [uncultured Flavobacterium sp.]
MIKIYHNPRCSKSREGLCFLEDQKIPHQIIKYLDEELTVEELTNIIKILNISPIELVRTKEEIWKTNYKNETLTDEEIIKIMVENPKLIERPIVINGNQGVIARPFSKINEII